MILLEIHKMIKSLLDDSEELVSKVSGIESFVLQPNDTGAKSFPYVTIGEDSFREFDTATELGFEAEISVETWSRQRGVKETLEVQDLIYQALHHAEYDSEEFHLVTMDHVDSSNFMEPDGITRRGVSVFNVLVDLS